MAKKVLIIINNPPIGTVFPAEAVRAGIAFAGMDLNTSLVFSGDGVFSLFKDQKPELIGAGSIKEGLSNAEEFGLKIFADKESLEEKKVAESEIEKVDILNNQKIKDLISSAEVIINF